MQGKTSYGLAFAVKIWHSRAWIRFTEKASTFYMMTPQHIKHAKKLNILFSLTSVNDANAVECRIYVGDKKRIPPHIYESFFKESITRKLFRWCVRFIARFIFFSQDPEWGSRICWIPVNKIDNETLLVSWQIEDVFHLLNECGFCLYAQENDGAFWTPHGVFQELVELKRICCTMPVYLRNRAGNQFVLTDTWETRRGVL